MSSIASLIDPQVVQQMTAIAANVDATTPAKTKRKAPKVKHGTQPIVTEFLDSGTRVDRVLPARHHPICKCDRCGRGTSVPMTPEQYEAKYGVPSTKAPRRLEVADAIDIDPRSAALIDVNCVDCGAAIRVDPQDFEPGFFDDPESLFFPLCTTHAQLRAINNQRKAEDAKRTTTKEQDMDLDNIADAELGATVKEQIRQQKAKKVKAAKPKVEAERKKQAKEAKKATKAKQAERKVVLASFMVGTTLEVPALDLTQVPSLDEAPSAAERSPYNKARFRLLKESPLDPEVTTYRSLIEEHNRLRDAEAQRVAANFKALGEKNAKKAKKAKAKKVTAVVADVKPIDKAKVAALAEVLGVSKKEARKVMAAL